MQDPLIYSYPYRCPGYDSKFINRKVITRIREFCIEHPIIRTFLAKGSIVYGTMIEGSDIDHVRIQTSTSLSVWEKKMLVDDMEEQLRMLGVSFLRRVREDDYKRVFHDWSELSDLVLANSTKHEIYPFAHILTAKDKVDWFRRIIETGYLYNSKAPADWIKKVRDRIF
jgi:hypothetical protein